MPDKKSGRSSSQSKGMGLGDKANKGGKNKAGRNGSGSKAKAGNGANTSTDGAKKASEGAGRLAQGAGRVSAGDLSGAGDVARGAKDLNDGVGEMKDGLDTSSNEADAESSSSPDKTPDGEHDDAGKGSDGLKDGMSGLLSEDKDSDDKNSGDASTKGDADDEDLSLKDIRKMAKNTARGAGTVAGVQAVQSMLMLYQWLKMMLAQGVTAVMGAWAAVMGAIVNAATWVAGVTGLSTAWAIGVTVASAVGGGIGLLVVGTTMLLTPNVSELEGSIDCVPTNTSVSADILEWQDSGENSALRTLNIIRAWSVFNEMGINDVAAAGILGNFDMESGIDPTGVETIYNEKYQIGPRKAEAEASGFDIGVMNPAYSARFPSIKQAGIGLGQWTNGRNIMLRDYANERGLLWHDIGTQLAFMFDGDNPGDIQVLWNIVNTPDLTLNQATERFMMEWERPNAAAYHLDDRFASASNVYFDLTMIEVDETYAQSIISSMNVDVAEANTNRSAYFKDDGCGNEIGTYYGGQADGTGVFPDDVAGTTWDPARLPRAVGAFAHDPEDLGMRYRSSEGWISTGHGGQCVALSHSYMEKLYPGVVAPRGANGGGVAQLWYDTYAGTIGGTLSPVPSAGAVFQYDNSGIYGHTGMVDHVFANGDILIVEQNVRGYSGDNNGQPYTWNWRYVTKEQYQTDAGGSRNWLFYKPDLNPAW